MRQEQLKGHLEGLVLAVLARESLHGYAIMEALEEQSGGVLSVEGGTLYPVLHRLEAAHLISGKWSIQSGRKRRTYALTARGKAALASERGEWKDFVRALGGIMAPAGGASA